jgi:hypothetical protein
MIAATGNQSHSKDLIPMNRKLLNVVTVPSLILPIRIAAADSLNARPGRWTITRIYVRCPGRTMRTFRRPQRIAVEMVRSISARMPASLLQRSSMDAFAEQDGASDNSIAR